MHTHTPMNVRTMAYTHITYIMLTRSYVLIVLRNINNRTSGGVTERIKKYYYTWQRRVLEFVNEGSSEVK